MQCSSIFAWLILDLHGPQSRKLVKRYGISLFPRIIRQFVTLMVLCLCPPNWWRIIPSNSQSALNNPSLLFFYLWLSPSFFCLVHRNSVQDARTTNSHTFTAYVNWVTPLASSSAVLHQHGTVSGLAHFSFLFSALSHGLSSNFNYYPSPFPFESANHKTSAHRGWRTKRNGTVTNKECII